PLEPTAPGPPAPFLKPPAESPVHPTAASRRPQNRWQKPSRIKDLGPRAWWPRAPCPALYVGRGGRGPSISPYESIAYVPCAVASPTQCDALSYRSRPYTFPCLCT